MVAFIDEIQHDLALEAMIERMLEDTETKERLGLAVAAYDLSRRQWEDVQEALEGM